MKNKLNIHNIIKRLSGYCSTTLLVVALCLQCNFASASENHDPKNTEDNAGEEISSKGNRSKLAVRYLKEREDQEHIKMKAEVTITEDSNGTISEIKFKNEKDEDGVYTFSEILTEDKREEIPGLTIITVIALEQCGKKSSPSHVIKANLVKLAGVYTTIDYDYWDSENCSSNGVFPSHPLGHSRGGGGGWNN